MSSKVLKISSWNICNMSTRQPKDFCVKATPQPKFTFKCCRHNRQFQCTSYVWSQAVSYFSDYPLRRTTLKNLTLTNEIDFLLRKYVTWNCKSYLVESGWTKDKFIKKNAQDVLRFIILISSNANREKKNINTNDIKLLKSRITMLVPKWSGEIGSVHSTQIVQTHFFQIVCMSPNRSLLPETSTTKISQIQRKKKTLKLIEEYSKLGCLHKQT